MGRVFITVVLPLLVAVGGGVAIGWWVKEAAKTPVVAERVKVDQYVSMAPPDGGGEGNATDTAVTDTTVTGTTVTDTTVTDTTVIVPPKVPPTAISAPPSKASGSWSQFRGADRDGISKQKVALNLNWDAKPPKTLWEISDLGEGYAGATVRDGRVYVLDYDQANKGDDLRCFDLDTGKQVWHYMYPVKVVRNHGMSRTVPAVTDKYVVTFGPRCDVYCFDVKTGKPLWNINTVTKYGGEVPDWHAGQCPLVDGDKVILGTGGPKALLAALDCATGKELWTTPNPRSWLQSHTSVLKHTVSGQGTYVYASRGGVTAVDAGTGKVAWEITDWPQILADSPSPIDLGGGRLFIARAYEKGAMIVDVKGTKGALTATIAKNLPMSTFGSDQHTPIFYKGHVYGVRPPPSEELVCLDRDGAEKWASKEKFGIGPYLIAEGNGTPVIIVMNDTGMVTVAQASPAGYKVLTRKQLLSGHETWGPMALVDGKLLLRDTQYNAKNKAENTSKMLCVDLRK